MLDPATRDALLNALRDARALLARPDNDFAWSTWSDATKSLVELDGFISCIEAGHPFERLGLSILFAPTGDIQEVGLSSGWGKELLQVAERFDAAFARYG